MECQDLGSLTTIIFQNHKGNQLILSRSDWFKHLKWLAVNWINWSSYTNFRLGIIFKQLELNHKNEMTKLFWLGELDWAVESEEVSWVFWAFPCWAAESSADPEASRGSRSAWWQSWCRGPGMLLSNFPGMALTINSLVCRVCAGSRGKQSKQPSRRNPRKAECAHLQQGSSQRSPCAVAVS